MEKYEVYFPKRRKGHFQVFGKILKVIFISFLFFAVINSFFIASYSIDSVSMEPGLNRGNRVLASPFPYGIVLPFGSTRIGVLAKPERGEIAVVTPPYMKDRHPVSAMLEPLVNFFSLQTLSLFNDYSGRRLTTHTIKRIIAIPGDTVKLENFIAFIKPKGSEVFLRENEIIKKPYKPFIDKFYFPQGWISSFPFSGNMDPLTLGGDEYFVLGDSRGESNDSRAWGPVGITSIVSRVVLRYWPLSKIAGF